MEDTNRFENGQAVKERGTGIFVVLGFIAAILSLFIYPFIFGVAGVILGILATKKGSRTGLGVIVLSILLMGVGLIFSPVILNYTQHYLGF